MPRPDNPLTEWITSDTSGHRRAISAIVACAGVSVAAIAVGTLMLDNDHGLLRVGFVIIGLLGLGLGLDLALARFVDTPAQTKLVLAVVWLAIVGFFAIFAGVLPMPESLDPGLTLSEPTLARPDILSAHPLGTDRHGLDLLGGLAHGARVSLTVGLGATVIGGVVGATVGIAAGFLRGRFDALSGLLTDAMLAFPALILLLAVVAVFRPSVVVVTLGLALLTIPSYVRLARANTLALAHKEFILTARAMGATQRRIIFRELLPNIFWPMVSFSVVVVAAMIVAEASLSYLGLSIQRPHPTWGNMIAAGQDSFQDHPHLVLVPGVAMFLTVLALNAVGEELQKRYSLTERNR